MYNAFRTSLVAKRAELGKDDKGFTLIELLVVILIIGILTAIAVPVFLNQQEQAKDAAAKSDLGVAKVALVSYFTANPNATAVTATDLGTFGYQQSDGIGQITIQTGATSSSFCIAAAVTGTDRTWHITGTKSATSGVCPVAGG